MQKNYVNYEDFGAIGDGIHDDMPAIVAAHDYANENGLPVKANDNATYYIGGKDLTAKIMTSTDFGNAKFIIDDRDVENRNSICFLVSGELNIFSPEIKSLKKNQKKISFPHEGTVYVKVTSNERRVYKRKGPNANVGNPISDAFMVDEEGNILNDINWDYTNIDSAYAYRIDAPELVICGGNFTTLANQAESKYTYYHRGFKIYRRPNVTIRNVNHYISGEGEHGAPYAAFFELEETCNTLIKDCVLTPHKIYYTEGKIPGQKVGMGTYEMNLKASLNLTLSGVSQTIDINNESYWPSMGSNFCKDMLIENCKMARFDAHCGITNGTIRNCELGFSGIALIGFGKFLIENTSARGDCFINFRPDYGSSFRGELTIRNCKWHPRGFETPKRICILGASNNGTHDFGYECGMPDKIVIDDLLIDDTDSPEDAEAYLFFNYDKTYAPDKPFPYVTPTDVTVNNVRTVSGRTIAPAEFPEQYPIADKIKI